MVATLALDPKRTEQLRAIALSGIPAARSLLKQLDAICYDDQKQKMAAILYAFVAMSKSNGSTLEATIAVVESTWELIENGA
jgi:K+-transporting ATPase A subunit